MQITSNYNTPMFTARRGIIEQPISKLPVLRSTEKETEKKVTMALKAMAAAAAGTIVLNRESEIEEEPIKPMYESVEEFEKHLNENGWDEYPEDKELLIRAYAEQPISYTVWDSASERPYIRSDIESLTLLSLYGYYPKGAKAVLEQVAPDRRAIFQGAHLLRLIPIADKHPDKVKEILEDPRIKAGKDWNSYGSTFMPVPYSIIPDIFGAYCEDSNNIYNVLESSQIKNFGYNSKIVASLCNASAKYPKETKLFCNDKDFMENTMQFGKNCTYENHSFYNVMKVLKDDPEYANKYFKLKDSNSGKYIRSSIEWAGLHSIYEKNPELFDILAKAYDKDYKCPEYDYKTMQKLMDKAETAPNAIYAFAHGKFNTSADYFICDDADDAEKVLQPIENNHPGLLAKLYEINDLNIEQILQVVKVFESQA